MVHFCHYSCQSDVGAAYQAQAYNLIKALDPYHAIIGASDCGDTWVFFDNAATCDWRGGHIHPGKNNKELGTDNPFHANLKSS